MDDTKKANKKQKQIHAPKAKSQGKESHTSEGQQMMLPGMESTGATFDVIDALTKAGIPFVDKREKGGSLWIVGGKELSEFVAECRNNDVKFAFKTDGGKATKGKPGWWTK